MKEIVIRHFFEGHATAAELAADAAGAFDRRTDSAGTVFRQLRATPMDLEFEVSPNHIVALVDAVLDQVIDLEALDAIAFCIEASDKFAWDTDTDSGDRVAKALFYLGAPEVNYPLTDVVLRRFGTFSSPTKRRSTRRTYARPDQGRTSFLSGAGTVANVQQSATRVIGEGRNFDAPYARS